MLVRDALPPGHPETLRDDDGVPHAARTLLHHRISSAPVLDARGTLVGIVSESDLLRGRVGRDPRAHLLPDDLPGDDPAGDPDDGFPELVADVMTPHPVTVDLRDDFAAAVDVLLDRGFKALPVLDGHHLVGILTRRDVLRTITAEDEDVRERVALRLRDDVPEQEWQIDVHDGVVTLDGPYDGTAHRTAAVLTRTVPGVVRVRTLDAPVSYDAPGRRSRPRGPAPR